MLPSPRRWHYYGKQPPGAGQPSLRRPGRRCASPRSSAFPDTGRHQDNRRKVTQHEQEAAGQAQVDFAFPLPVPGRSELPAALKAPSWASSRKHERVVPTCFVSASWRDAQWLVQLIESCLFFLFVFSLSVFFSPLCTRPCLSRSPVPALCSSLSAGSRRCPCPTQPQAASSPVPCQGLALPVPEHPRPRAMGAADPGTGCGCETPTGGRVTDQQEAPTGERCPPKKVAHQKGCPLERGAHWRRMPTGEGCFLRGLQE